MELWLRVFWPPIRAWLLGLAIFVVNGVVQTAFLGHDWVERFGWVFHPAGGFSFLDGLYMTTVLFPVFFGIVVVFLLLPFARDRASLFLRLFSGPALIAYGSVGLQQYFLSTGNLDAAPWCALGLLPLAISQFGIVERYPLLGGVYTAISFAIGYIAMPTTWDRSAEFALAPTTTWEWISLIVSGLLAIGSFVVGITLEARWSSDRQDPR
ncbi:hypothetical protein [Granulicoccus sp. GXG6511]|uniref:hypothetical protein n=1 Tax=Granulicoccus sp. GXG6511 TaxID=3381351 RepID=UPI003D7E204A